MSISEKLMVLANNTEKVFNAGYNKCLKENPPGASEEELNAKYQEGYSEGYDEGYDEGYNVGFSIGWQDGSGNGWFEGKQAEYDAFWDAFQNNGNRTDYSYAFCGWTDETYKPKYSICGNLTGGFNNSKITNTLVPIVVIGSTTVLFNNCSNLNTIISINLEKASTSTNTFNYCGELMNITITGVIERGGFDIHWSTKLSKASIESIINALSTTTSGLTITLSAEAVANAFTDAEWEALEATKSNWTISLV